MSYISMAEAAALSPVPVNPVTVWRWARDGIGTKAGRKKLRHRRIGRRVVTTRRWVREFLAACEKGDK